MANLPDQNDIIWVALVDASNQSRLIGIVIHYRALKDRDVLLRVICH